MKKTAFSIVLVLSSIFLFAQTPNWVWVAQSNGTVSDIGSGMAVTTDSLGYVYGTGHFEGSITFGSTTLTSNGNDDIYVVKYDSLGNCIWATSGGDIGTDIGYNIVYSPSGYIYVTGNYDGTATFQTETLPTVSVRSGLLLKYDLDGNIIWSKGFGEGQITEAVISDAGNIYLAGRDVKSPVFYKYNESGTQLWAKTMSMTPYGGGDNGDGTGIDIDKNENVYVSINFNAIGSWEGTDYTPNLSTGAYDILVSKLNTDGNVVWSKQMSPQVTGATLSSDDLILNVDTGIIVCGGFVGDVIFDVATETSVNNYDLFLLSLDTAGNYNWIYKYNETTTDRAYDLAHDNLGNIYTYGISPNGTAEKTVISKSDKYGNLIWKKDITGSMNQNAHGIALSIGGCIYVTAPVNNNNGVTSFDEISISSNSAQDAVIGKLCMPSNKLFTPKLLSAGGSHSLITCRDSTVLTWGSNNLGQLGNGTTVDSNTPVQVSSLDSVISIAEGAEDHSLVLTSDYTVWSWGINDFGQLGDGTGTYYSGVPVKTLISGVNQISGGYAHSMALKHDGTVWSWGYNLQGQLGIGTNVNENSPKQVMFPKSVFKIASRQYHSMAITNDSTVWTWGYNANGQLGDGTNTDSNIPQQLNGLTDIISVAAGWGHSLALKSDGTVWGWGYNLYGCLGNGTNTNTNTPVQVSSLTDVVAIACGFAHSIALKSDGTIWTWGQNTYGQLGNGNNTNTNTPVQVVGISNAIEITSGGNNHNLAILDDGTVWAWGINSLGQLGIGPIADSDIPVQVTGACAICVPIDSTQDISICSTDSVFAGGAYQNTTGTYIDTYTSSNGCDSIVTTNLTVPSEMLLSISNIQEPFCNGGSDGSLNISVSGGTTNYTYNWNTGATTSGISALSAGNYSVSVVDVNGCLATDSYTITEPIAMLTGLSIVNASCGLSNGEANITISNGTPPYTYSWSNGATVASLTGLSVGNIDVSVTDSNGCLSTSNGTIADTGTSSISVTDSQSICEGDSIYIEGAYQFSSSIYYDTLTAVNMCDSIIETTLTVYPSYLITVTETICQGDSILLEGAYQTTPGVYTDSHQTSNLCDSIIETTLIVNSTYFITTNASICQGDSILLGGVYQTTAGVYDDVFPGVNTCDSIIQTTLSIADTASNVFSGYVYFQGNPITSGEVRLIRKDANSPQSMWDVDSTFVDATGYFEFDSVLPANYLIKAKGDTALYDNVTTYGDSTNHWQHANNYDITGYCNDTISGINVYLIDFPTTIGFGNINGQITNGGPGRAGDPIPGIDVALEQIPGGIIAGHDLSDQDGKFAFNNIEQGSYVVHADILGYVSETTEVFVFSDENITYNIELCAEEESDTVKVCSREISSINELKDQLGIQMYPNPTSGDLFIQVDAVSFDVAVSDVTGKLLLTKSVNNSFIRLKLDGYDAGVYLVEVNSNNVAAQQKLVIQR